MLEKDCLCLSLFQPSAIMECVSMEGVVPWKELLLTSAAAPRDSREPAANMVSSSFSTLFYIAVSHYYCAEPQCLQETVAFMILDSQCAEPRMDHKPDSTDALEKNCLSDLCE